MKICLSCEQRHNQKDWSCPGCHRQPAQRGGFLSFAPQVLTDEVGFRREYYPQLARVEETSFWFQSRNRLLSWALGNFYPATQSLLEIGCGTGFVLQEFRSSFPRLKLAGSEILCDGLEIALRRVPQASLFQMDARRIPFEEEFDVIGAFDVLEHIEEDDVVLEQMYKATKPAGGIILTVPQHQWLWSETDKVDGHYRRYRRVDLRRKVQKAGFRVLAMTSFVSLLLPLMWLVRVSYSRKAPGAQQSFMSEFNIGRVLNRSLAEVMRIERGFIRAGISFPAGGSLLVAACKD